MAEFQVGDRVRVTHRPGTLPNMLDRVGTIAMEPPHMLYGVTESGDLGEPIAPQYVVIFDDTGQGEYVEEAWLESI